MQMLHLSPQKIKWITDLNVKCKTIKLLEYNIAENLDDLWNSDDFLDTVQKTGSTKELLSCTLL